LIGVSPNLPGALFVLVGALFVLVGAFQILRRDLAYLCRASLVLVGALQVLVGALQRLGSGLPDLCRILQVLPGVPQILVGALQGLAHTLQVLFRALQILVGAFQDLQVGLQVVGAARLPERVHGIGEGVGRGGGAVVDRSRAEREVQAIGVGFPDIAVLVVHLLVEINLEAAVVGHARDERGGDIPVAIRGENGEVLLAGVLHRVGSTGGDNHAFVGAVAERGEVVGLLAPGIVATDARKTFAQRCSAVGPLGIEDAEPAGGLRTAVEVADFEKFRVFPRAEVIEVIHRIFRDAVVQLLRRDGDESGAVLVGDDQRHEGAADGRFDHLHASAIVGVPVGEAQGFVEVDAGRRVDNRARGAADALLLPDQLGLERIGEGAGGIAGGGGQGLGGGAGDRGRGGGGGGGGGLGSGGIGGEEDSVGAAFVGGVYAAQAGGGGEIAGVGAAGSTGAGGRRYGPGAQIFPVIGGLARPVGDVAGQGIGGAVIASGNTLVGAQDGAAGNATGDPDLVVGPIAIVIGAGETRRAAVVEIDRGAADRCARHQIRRHRHVGIARVRIVVNRVAQMAAVAGPENIVQAGTVGHVVERHRARVVHYQHDVGLDVGRAPVGQRVLGDVGAGGQHRVDHGEEGCRAENTGNQFGEQFLVHGWLSLKKHDFNVTQRIARPLHTGRDPVIGLYALTETIGGKLQPLIQTLAATRSQHAGLGGRRRRDGGGRDGGEFAVLVDGAIHVA
jgi:hypothetical protein